MGVLRLGLFYVAVLALLVNIIGMTSRAGAPSETRRELGALLTGVLAVVAPPVNSILKLDPVQ